MYKLIGLRQPSFSNVIHMTDPLYRHAGGVVKFPASVSLELEPLEPREHLSVSRDEQGWTVVTPSDDTKIIYVSSSQGSDRNDGRTSKSPVKTIAKGYDLLRDGKPDWLLLKTDDVFTEQPPTWRISGRSKDEPQLVGSYGPGEKPIIQTGSHH